MLTNAQLQTVINNNLASDSMYAVQLYLKALVDRGYYGTDISRYRCKIGGMDVVSYSDLITAISVASFTVVPSTNHNRQEMTARVVFTDLTVTVLERVEGDNWLSSTYGYGEHKLGFELGILAGVPEYFPLHIIRVFLTTD